MPIGTLGGLLQQVKGYNLLIAKMCLIFLISFLIKVLVILLVCKYYEVIVLFIVMSTRYYIYFFLSNVFFHYAEAEIVINLLGLYCIYIYTVVRR